MASATNEIVVQSSSSSSVVTTREPTPSWLLPLILVGLGFAGLMIWLGTRGKTVEHHDGYDDSH